MRFFTEKPIKDFIENSPEYMVILQDWVSIVKKCEWEDIEDITIDFNNAEIIEKPTVIFHLNVGNKHLDVEIMFTGKFLYVRKLGVRS